MMEPRLQKQLGALESGLRRARLLRRLANCWIGSMAFCLALFLVHGFTGWKSPLIWALPLLSGAVSAVLVWRSERRRPADFPALVAALERAHPELRHLLSAAAEQRPHPESGEFHFLQQRVIDEVVTHRRRPLWSETIQKQLTGAFVFQAAAFAALLIMLLFTGVLTGVHSTSQPWLAAGVTVSPGDTKVERGTGLVISAQFSGAVPPEATLVMISASGKTRRLPLERHFADPIFGASILEVTEDGLYHIEYANRKTPDYKITAFDYPALARADATLRFPQYTGLTNQTIPDTRRVSAVEGTHLSYHFELNKPVVRARLVPKTRGDALPLKVESKTAVATLDDLLLARSGNYSLELVDAEGRTNKVPAEFSIVVLPDRRPDVKIAFPRGDQRVSPLEEMQLQADASDDFGVLKYGIGFGIAGRRPQFVELGGPTRANEKRQFSDLIAMEKLGVSVNQVVSYFAWADDYGPDGKVRRTFSDMFFAEIRPFDEVFRPDQSGESGNAGGQGGGSSQATRLAELQKQIVIATWKLERDQTEASKE